MYLSKVMIKSMCATQDVEQKYNLQALFANIRKKTTTFEFSVIWSAVQYVTFKYTCNLQNVVIVSSVTYVLELDMEQMFVEEETIKFAQRLQIGFLLVAG